MGLTFGKPPVLNGAERASSGKFQPVQTPYLSNKIMQKGLAFRGLGIRIALLAAVSSNHKSSRKHKYMQADCINRMRSDTRLLAVVR